jgi:hypothetical protein
MLRQTKLIIDNDSGVLGHDAGAILDEEEADEVADKLNPFYSGLQSVQYVSTNLVQGIPTIISDVQVQAHEYNDLIVELQNEGKSFVGGRHHSYFHDPRQAVG